MATAELYYCTLKAVRPGINKWVWLTFDSAWFWYQILIFFSFKWCLYQFSVWVVIFSCIPDILAIMLEESKSNLNFLGGEHMFRFSIQAIHSSLLWPVVVEPLWCYSDLFSMSAVWQTSIGPCCCHRRGQKEFPQSRLTGVCGGREESQPSRCLLRWDSLFVLNSGCRRGASGLKSPLCLHTYEGGLKKNPRSIFWRAGPL